MSTSTTTEPLVEEVEGYNTDALITYLRGKAHLEINETEFQSLRDEGVNGYNFLRLNNELLKDCGIRVGQRASLIELISNLNSQKQPGATETTTNTGLVHVYVDHSNVVIEGKYVVGALEHIYDKANKTYYMSQFGIDFGCLLTVLQRNRQMGSNPVIVGSRPPPNDSLWKKIEDQGYEVKIYDREMFKDCDNKIHTKEKRVDTEIAVSMVIDTLIKIKNPGILILVAGDGDFEPALKPIMEAGWIVEVRFWTNSTSRHLKELKVGEKAVNFMPLDLEYKSFAFGSGPEPTNRKKSLEIFHKNTWENKDLIECYSGLQSSFCWWDMVDDENLVMYFKTNADLELAKRWLEKNFKDIQVWQKISLFVDAFRDCTNAIYCPNCTYCISEISEISESISITLMSVNTQHLM